MQGVQFFDTGDYRNSVPPHAGTHKTIKVFKDFITVLPLALTAAAHMPIKDMQPIRQYKPNNPALSA